LTPDKEQQPRQRGRHVQTPGATVKINPQAAQHIGQQKCQCLFVSARVHD
jgi:hypothetical protein